MLVLNIRIIGIESQLLCLLYGFSGFDGKIA
jgi:hypothetical protein